MRSPLPFDQELIPRAPYTPELLRAVEQAVTSGACSEGFLFVERDDSYDLLLFVRGKTYLAGRMQRGEMRQLPIKQLFAELRDGDPPTCSLYVTSLSLLLSIAVIVQQRPTLRVPVGLADGERILADLASRAQDSALAIWRDGRPTLVFCHAGEPRNIYYPEGSERPKEPTLGQELLVYLHTIPPQSDARVEVFYELKMQRDPLAGRPFVAYTAQKIDAPPFFITVTRGSEVVARRLFRQGQATFGRDPDNDVVLNHPSVSRRHASIEWQGEQFVVVDNESANGTRLRGERTSKANLSFGDTLGLGAFEVSFAQEPEGRAEHPGTMFLDDPTVAAGSASLLHEGAVVPVNRAVFTVGRSTDAHLRLKGLWLAPIQATIVREAATRFRLCAIDAGRRVTLNGQKVGVQGTLLRSGDQITVAGQKLVFLLADAG